MPEMKEVSVAGKYLIGDCANCGEFYISDPGYLHVCKKENLMKKEFEQLLDALTHDRNIIEKEVKNLHENVDFLNKEVSDLKAWRDKVERNTSQFIGFASKDEPPDHVVRVGDIIKMLNFSKVKSYMVCQCSKQLMLIDSENFVSVQGIMDVPFDFDTKTDIDLQQCFNGATNFKIIKRGSNW